VHLIRSIEECYFSLPASVDSFRVLEKIFEFEYSFRLLDFILSNISKISELSLIDFEHYLLIK